MAYITIVRHGQSESNLAGLVESRSEGKLTETGIETARTLGKFIKDEKFTRIYSSDLNRCRETVEHVVSQLETTVPSVTYRADLRERDFGDSELAPAKTVWDTIMKAGIPLHLAHTVEAPNGEPYENARERANNFLQEIFALVDTGTESSAENILVVTHGVFIRCLLDNILENPDLYEVQNADEELRERVPKNTCRTRFSVGQIKENPNGKRAISFTHYFDLEHLN
jgi:broad specificity phosphatase PhoE